MCDPGIMRTTLEIDDDLLTAARRLAQQEGVSLGRLISRLALDSLQAKTAPTVRNGIPLFKLKAGGARPDLNLINQLRDSEHDHIAPGCKCTGRAARSGPPES